MDEKDYDFILSLLAKILKEKNIDVNVYKKDKNFDKELCNISLFSIFSGLIY